MKRLLIALILAASTSALYAQAQTEDADENKDKMENNKWYLKGISGLNFSQTSLSNWAAGGDNAFGGNLYLNGSLNRKSGNWLFANTFAFEYGLNNTASAGTQKTVDRLEFSSQLGYSTDHIWYYTVMGDFRSQFAKGFNYPDKTNYISKFMAPAYSNISVGLEYRPNKIYSVYMSPIATKLTFVEDDFLSGIGAFGVDPGDRFMAEMGAFFKIRAQRPLMENVSAITAADFFTAYDSSFGNIDINWDLMINMKINKYLSATISTSLKYDDDVKIKSFDEQGQLSTRGPRVQFKEVIGVGLAYNF
ncbi:DUF3078 domain-containing protein [Dysgonomonas sp. ZJ709]|uniref:DUF3078 domain-containing protein n=1 Tax=Dysgonomonas sp. ZJ709 TaxID=2709797 RepID=UPI0013ED40D3|nr:DUF3078 domain-containing protein [Dysgonomonas sp. ZJ709]